MCDVPCCSELCSGKGCYLYSSSPLLNNIWLVLGFGFWVLGFQFFTVFSVRNAKLYFSSAVSKNCLLC